jgi:hypothetical protein
MSNYLNTAQDPFILNSLDFDVLPGGATEPVIHWGGVLLVIELLRSSPAH